MAYKVRMRKNIRIGRVITKIASTLVALWAGGLVVQELGTVMVGNCSPFFRGLSLIGWDIGTNATAYAGTCAGGTAGPSGCDATHTANSTLSGNIDPTCEAINSGTILYDTGDAGVLAIVGLVGLASIVLEFVEFKM